MTESREDAPAQNPSASLVPAEVIPEPAAAPSEVALSPLDLPDLTPEGQRYSGGMELGFRAADMLQKQMKGWIREKIKEQIKSISDEETEKMVVKMLPVLSQWATRQILIQCSAEDVLHYLEVINDERVKKTGQVFEHVVSTQLPIFFQTEIVRWKNGIYDSLPEKG